MQGVQVGSLVEELTVPHALQSKKKKKQHSNKFNKDIFKKTELNIVAVLYREHWGMSVLSILGGCFGRCYVFYLHVASLSLEEEAVPC